VRSTKTIASPSNRYQTNHEPDAFNGVRLFILKIMKTESEEQTEYPFTADQYKALTPERRQAIKAVAEYLTGSGVPTGENLTDEEITCTFNLLKPCEGCVPPEEADSDLLTVIRKKFGAVYEVGLEMAEEELKNQAYSNLSFCMVVDPSYEDATHVAIIDYNNPICHLHEWIKPWHLSFENLNLLADAVLAVKNRLVEKITKPTEIFMVVEGGVIHEVVDLPDYIPSQ
jgi:hypothetical protein